MHTGLTIGEFATLTHLSIRTLRRYHQAGLLEPVEVDPHNSYRYYSAEQIPIAQVIHQLRELDVPLAEVKALLATGDPETRSQLIAGHLDRLEKALNRTQAAVVSLRQLLRPEGQDPQIEVRSIPARTVPGITAKVELCDSRSWYAGAMAELEATFPRSDRTGPPAGRYANELFTKGRGTMTVYLPVRAPRASGRIEIVDLAAVELAVAIHPGNHDDIDVTYGRLGSWVASNALAVDGPVYETYLVGPRDTDMAEQWRTEIGWPIFRIAVDGPSATLVTGLGDRLVSHDAGLEELGDHLSQGVDGLPPVGREQIPGDPPVG
ncbi:MAG TPA: MerR family transcriptional regulator [Streptosporangiaceae bacterium]|nr:MerR family transcriptional regulator [Streptosporangiaceae bacterium]